MVRLLEPFPRRPAKADRNSYAKPPPGVPAAEKRPVLTIRDEPPYSRPSDPPPSESSIVLALLLTNPFVSAAVCPPDTRKNVSSPLF